MVNSETNLKCQKNGSEDKNIDHSANFYDIINIKFLDDQ